MNDRPDYSKCWAKVLGDCAGKMTREHHISRNQFEGAITIQGYSWCRDKSVTIGIDSLTSKNLCRHHNNTTSPLDSAADAFLEAIRTTLERANLMKQRPRQLPRRTLRISGDNFERWLLKTTINLGFHSDPAPTGGIFDQAGWPDRRFVEIVYGRESFQADEGLMLVAKVGDQIPNSEIGTIRFAPWFRRSDNGLVASHLTFHGRNVWLATAGAPSIENRMHPPRTVKVEDVDLLIEFEWSNRRERQFRKRDALRVPLL